jgi:hypothetical protein
VARELIQGRSSENFFYLFGFYAKPEEKARLREWLEHLQQK